MGGAGALFLLVQLPGGKLWRLNYRGDGKEKKLPLGAYPAVGLGEACRRRHAARAELATGQDPGGEKARRKAQGRIAIGNSFANVAAEFIQKRTKGCCSE
ncbi:integrase arm-type DNA-binding domain-containing protein [Sphingobium mellinum]|uniref:integrase arm-type DNA-binding domain-containing protein n=1 Tax=Sphingobium mellinum TaxID=1387166 RepID=UPI0030EE65B1